MNHINKRGTRTPCITQQSTRKHCMQIIKPAESCTLCLPCKIRTKSRTQEETNTEGERVELGAGKDMGMTGKDGQGGSLVYEGEEG